MKKQFVIDQSRGPHIRDYSDQSQDRVVICSGDHYWREDGCGYTNAQMAGVYTRDDAYKRAGHCGPEKGCCFYDVPAGHVPTLQAKLSEAHRVIMAKCCPGPENWPDDKEWWQVAADRIDTLTGILRAGKEELWAATHGSDEGGFEPTDWVIAAEKALAGDSHVPTLQAEVERLRAYRDAETVRCAKADCYDRICQHLGVTSNVIGTIAERERRVKEQAVAEWLEKKSSGLGFVDMDRDEVLAEIAALRLGGAI